MNPTVEKANTNVARLLNVINASVAKPGEDGKQVPLQLVPSGIWTDSWKGTIDISVTDLKEMKANFDAGIGLAGGGVAGAPIDYAHAEWDKAAGWITAVEVINGILCATSYEWTTEAAAAIESGEWKFFSPSFVPVCIGSWCDPEDPSVTARNVLLGGGLTNKPFFKGLTGLINASETREGNDGTNKIYISAINAQGEKMNETVSAILAKDPQAITAEERQVLKDNRTHLRADQIEKFEVDKVEASEDKNSGALKLDASQYPQEVKDAIALQASIAAGSHQLVEKSVLVGLQASVATLEADKKKAAESHADNLVDEAVRAGQIKSGDREAWRGLILASEANVTLLQNLPKSKEIGRENGFDATESQLDASSQLDAEVKTLMASEKLDYGTAAKRIMTEKPELAAAYVNERAQQ